MKFVLFLLLLSNFSFANEEEKKENLEEATEIVKTLENDLNKCWDSKIKSFIDC